MKIKELVGKRIREERQACGLTQAKLAELAGGLTQPRINNWEKGIRMPGADEIKKIAQVLNVAPAYLMCMTEHKETNLITCPQNVTLIPLVTQEQISNYQEYTNTNNVINKTSENIITYIPYDNSESNFDITHMLAIKMLDASMQPYIEPNDILLVNTGIVPKPGDFVLANHLDQYIVRRYKQLSSKNPMVEFELIASDTLWPNIINQSSNKDAKIIGTVTDIHRRVNQTLNSRKTNQLA